MLSFIGALWVALMSSAVATGQQAPVSRALATVEVVPGDPAVIVRITNNAKVALEAWQIRITYEATSGATSSSEIRADTNLSAVNPNPDRGPIAPFVTREYRFALSTVAAKASIQLLMAAFVDGTWEGSQSEVNALLRAREKNAAALKVWVDALQTVSTQAPQHAKAYLKKLIAAQRGREESRSAAAEALLDDMAALAALEEPDSAFTGRVAAIKRRLEQQLRLSLRHKGEK